jgi:hypothetical protein
MDASCPRPRGLQVGAGLRLAVHTMPHLPVESALSFKFRKLYADLVTDGGDVCVAYLAWLQIWRWRTAFAGLELYWADGRREVIRATRSPTEEDILHGKRAFEVRLELPEGPFVLSYEDVLPAWDPGHVVPSQALSWSVGVPRGEVVARWLHDSERPVLFGRGYTDWVEINRPPRRLGLRQLEWGRVHLPDVALVFNSVRFGSGPGWMRAAEWSERAGTAEWHALRLETQRNSTRLSLPARRWGSGRCVIMEHHRTLHRGPALDAARFPRVLERLGTHALTGLTQETRWLSRVQAPDYGSGATAWALHERVRFGSGFPGSASIA